MLTLNDPRWSHRIPSFFVKIRRTKYLLREIFYPLISLSSGKHIVLQFLIATQKKFWSNICKCLYNLAFLILSHALPCLKIWKNLYKVFVIDFKEVSTLQYIQINKFIAMLGNTYKKYKSKIFRGYWKNGI